MSEPYIGEIRLASFGFAPRFWALCYGQILPIAQNQALFSLLGTTFGGNGQSTFALPNLRDRIPIGAGQGPGLSNRFLGENGGLAGVSLTTAQMPAHNHVANVSNQNGNFFGPISNYPASNKMFRQPSGQHMAPIAAAGGGQPHNNMQPSLTLAYIICLSGFFPPQ